MTKIERYAQSKGLCICICFFEETGFNGVYAIFDIKLRYQYFEFELKSEEELDIDKQLRNNYKKVKKYVDMVHEWKKANKIEYYPKLVLKF
jgi:hypothetical protein